MKTILCFGDSNTWGWDPSKCTRYGRNERWPGIMRNELGPDYEIIEEGLPGRTTVFDDPIEGVFKNGSTYLQPCLESHQPVKLVIIMLGTNDLKIRFSASAFDIANGAGVLVDMIKSSSAGPGNAAPQILLLAPPPLGQLGDFDDMFRDAPEKSLKFAHQYERVARERNCHFLDLSGIVTTSDVDGVHLDKAEHVKLGTAVAEYVKKLIGS